MHTGRGTLLLRASKKLPGQRHPPFPAGNRLGLKTVPTNERNQSSLLLLPGMSEQGQWEVAAAKQKQSRKRWLRPLRSHQHWQC